MSSRRDFLKTSAAVAAVAAIEGCGNDANNNSLTGTQSQTQLSPAPIQGRPNILLMLVDEMRLPPVGYGPNEGEIQEIKEILGFRPLSENNNFARYFPAFMRLRRNAVVARKHYIASTACAPSRTTFLTGQYPSLHGCKQVDGIFKDAAEITFLKPDTVPTIGDWFRAAGYSTHYMGKWHVSDTSQPPFDLEPYGFADYSTSGPEPHGHDVNNLGTFRDPGFADIVSNFLTDKAAERAAAKKPTQPWFAVASFVNPHDNGAYPAPFFMPGGLGVTDQTADPTNPQQIPPRGTISHTNGNGISVSLNPEGFPQNVFNLPPSWNEDLSTKPRCHLEAAWKVQMSLSAVFPLFVAIAFLPYPTQALPSPDQENWVRSWGQFYVYLQHLVNLEMTQVLQRLDLEGLSEDTIVVFTSDHGSYAMSHNQMVQKFYAAYEEATRVPFVVSGPRVNPGNQILEVTQPTSHIDLAPTLLGLAGFNDNDIALLKNAIQGHSQVRDFPGKNLVPVLLRGGQVDRPGVLFTTTDEGANLATNVPNPSGQENFNKFAQQVDLVRQVKKAPLVPGTVPEPNAVNMLCTGDWKYCRYFDEQGVEADQYEMYHLPTDPNEMVNLVNFETGLLRPGVSVAGFSGADLEAQRVLLRQQLAQEEARNFLTPV